MHWIIQNNLYSEKGFYKLINALIDNQITFSIVKVIPFVGEIIPDIRIDEKVFLCGGTSMCKLKNEHPNYLYFDKNMRQDIHMEMYKHHMLNYDSTICKFKDLEPSLYQFFMRPVLDNKSFTGRVFDREEFSQWRIKIVELEEQTSKATVRPDDLIVCSSVKEIYSEARFFIVNNEIVSCSMYREFGVVKYSYNVDVRYKDFVKQMIDIWVPNEAFVMDIADTNEGLKIVELNAINSAGFYDIDLNAFVYAIEHISLD